MCDSYPVPVALSRPASQALFGPREMLAVAGAGGAKYLRRAGTCPSCLARYDASVMPLQPPPLGTRLRASWKLWAGGGGTVKPSTTLRTPQATVSGGSEAQRLSCSSDWPPFPGKAISVASAAWRRLTVTSTRVTENAITGSDFAQHDMTLLAVAGCSNISKTVGMPSVSTYSSMYWVFALSHGVACRRPFTGVLKTPKEAAKNPSGAFSDRQRKAITL
ncbi:hypothetical protein ACSS6W_000827 [Trichoderma asperelloides]